MTLYKLLRRYLDDPKPESVLEQRRGWTKGRSRLNTPTTDIITAAIDDTYLTRVKPPVSKLVREINGRLRRAGLKEVMAKRSACAISSTSWVPYRVAQLVEERFRFLIDFPRRSRMPCLLVSGDPGMG